jgi:class 3 adenylate cyclase
LATPILSDTTEGSVQSVGVKRKLTAILHADVTGYSRLMGVDEDGTHQALKAHRQITDATIARHGGRVVGTAGDSVLADFPSVIEALSAAVEIQRTLQDRNARLPPDRRLEFRIGINLGDVIVDGGEIYGDGVNVAARLEALAEPGGIAMSGGVFDQVKNKLDLRYRDRGRHRVKNIAEPIRVYGVELADGVEASQRSLLRLFWTAPRVRVGGARHAACRRRARLLADADVAQRSHLAGSQHEFGRRGCCWPRRSGEAVDRGLTLRQPER